MRIRRCAFSSASVSTSVCLFHGGHTFLMPRRQLLLKRFQGDTFGLRHDALNVNPAHCADHAIEEEAARGTESGIQQWEGVGQQEQAIHSASVPTDIASPRTRLGKISESSTQVTGASVSA